MRGGRRRRYHGKFSRPYNCDDDKCLDFICLELFSPATDSKNGELAPPSDLVLMVVFIERNTETLGAASASANISLALTSCNNWRQKTPKNAYCNVTRDAFQLFKLDN